MQNVLNIFFVSAAVDAIINSDNYINWMLNSLIIYSLSKIINLSLNFEYIRINSFIKYLSKSIFQVIFQSCFYKLYMLNR